LVDEDKSSFKRQGVTFIKPEAKWSNYEQAENIVVIHIGGLNSCL